MPTSVAACKSSRKMKRMVLLIGEARNFYQNVKAKGYGTGLLSYKDKDGNLVTETQSLQHIRMELVPEGSARERISKIITFESNEIIKKLKSHMKNNTSL